MGRSATSAGTPHAQARAGTPEDELTSNYTLLTPLRFHLWRQVRRRAESLGYAVDLHEDRLAAGAPFPVGESRLYALGAR